MAYRVQLSPSLAAILDIFHVSQLKKYLRVPTETISATDIQLEPDLSYEEQPIKILDQKERATRNRALKFFKIQWSNHTEDEATWESEAYLRKKYPAFMDANQGASYYLTLPLTSYPSSLSSESWDEILLRGEGCNTLSV